MIMTDLQTAKQNLNGHTICLCRQGKCLCSDKRGIAPMMEFIAAGVGLAGYSAADKVVGKAAALLFVKCGVIAVYAETLSETGRAVLEEYGIAYEYQMLAEQIVNRAGTDICPMEKAVLHCNDAETAYALLKNKLKELSK